MSWVRLWCDMPTDPKWRVIAKRSGRSIAEVIAVFTAMMANAGANANERGVLNAWCDEDVAASLDMDTEAVLAIREAMQGKTLDGDALSGWEKRQPKREDNSSERAKRWRELKRTQANAEKRPDTDSEIDSDTDKTATQSRATLPEISDLKTLSDRLHEVAAPCLASQAIAPGLASMMVPQMWLDQGADLERDIVPTIENFVRRGKRNIGAWDYFTRPVAEAKAKRLGGLPHVDLPMGAAPVRKPKSFAQFSAERAAQ